MSNQTSDEHTSLEDKLAAIAAAMQGQQFASEVASPVFACPIDPAERAMCEGCQ